MQIDSYIEYIEKVRRYSPRTVAVYRDALERFAEYSGAEPDRVNVRNYEVHLLDDEKLGARTANLHLSVLSGYCKFLVRKGLLETNPVKLLPKPKQEKRLPVFYRQDAMKAYFEHSAPEASQDALDLLLALPPQDGTAELLYTRRLRRLIVSILANTGIRRSELISLNCNSANYARRELSVLGKGNKMRIIPLLPALCEEILLYLKAADHILGAERGGDTPLLRTLSARRLYPVFVDRAVKEELGNEDAIVGRKSPHVLRHTLASGLLEQGTDLNSIKELLGHSSLAATQVYTHASVERLKQVYEYAHPRANKNGGNNGDHS